MGHWVEKDKKKCSKFGLNWKTQQLNVKEMSMRWPGSSVRVKLIFCCIIAKGTRSFL